MFPIQGNEAQVVCWGVLMVEESSVVESRQRSACAISDVMPVKPRIDRAAWCRTGGDEAPRAVWWSVNRERLIVASPSGAWLKWCSVHADFDIFTVKSCDCYCVFQAIPCNLHTVCLTLTFLKNETTDRCTSIAIYSSNNCKKKKINKNDTL